MKKCGNCNLIKSYSCFYKSRGSSDGFQNRCKSCAKSSKKEWAKKNKEHLRESKRKWDLKNSEHCRNYRVKNKESIKKNTSNWYKKNKDRKLNMESERLRTDYLFKVKHNIRRNIRGSMMRLGYNKNSRTSDILGCDYNFFCEWLGGFDDSLHLDHVVPISLAETESDVYLLNHYSNFQAISSIENLSKGDRYIKKENYQRVLKNHPKPQLIKNIVIKSGIKLI